ncbi:hypothetical protein CANCADRAFT_1934 [Tortispora caseinolytica NRRL Y-17796]|uniref:Vacuolar protein sorting-associated protein n=1 Tax=Tortispora caseinolytica NRRL Y-17796 TaxID=767744 RepID=A0A1E4TEL2_9ASCO|nr:hypothetical protein CANCADRAFT_1934 [Tortispora caseinolytica NRRL Y-17796]
MLEGLVASILNNVLGAYVKNFDPKLLNIGIWGGDVSLKRLELKKEALDELRLPVDVVEGYLGSLTLQIPWSSLKTKPVRINIKDVYLLALPRVNLPYDAEEEEKRAQALKLDKLNTYELLHAQQDHSADMSKEEQRKNESFLQSLTSKIIDNLQVSIENIHIRYEDDISAPDHPFSIGVTLSELSAITTDRNWIPNTTQTLTDITYKLSKLKHLSVYWNTDAQFIKRGSFDEFTSSFASLISSDSNTPEGLDYILKPVSGVARIILDKSNGTNRPKARVRLLFEDISIVLDEYQYRDSLLLADLFHVFIRTQKFRKLRPKVSKSEDPKAWFAYAARAVYNEIHARNEVWTWEYMQARRNKRNEYIKLFKDKLLEKLTPENSVKLDQLEFELSYDDIRLYRTLARNQLKQERISIKLAEPKKQPAATSWSSWLWGSSSTDNAAQTSADSEEGQIVVGDTVITEEQRKEFYEAIEWDERKALADIEHIPRDYVRYQLHLELTAGGFTLVADPHNAKQEVASISFDTFKSTILVRPDSFLFGMSLKEFTIMDGTTPNSLYSKMVRLNKSSECGTSSHEVESRLSSVRETAYFDEEEDEEDVKDPLDEEESPENEPFFQFSLEQNPLDELSDSKIAAKIRSVELFYNPHVVEEIVHFFKPPKKHMETIGALLHAASATVEGITSQTRAGLEYALQEHKTVSAKLDIQAPVIYIPRDVTDKNSSCLVFNIGHVYVGSSLADKETLKSIQAKQNKQYSEQDWKRLEEAMYDRFNLLLNSTEILIAPSHELAIASLSEVQSKYSLLDKISINLLLAVSIMPSAANLTRVKMSANLPELKVRFSDWKYHALMEIIDASIPQFADESTANDSLAVTGANTPKETIDDNSSQTPFDFSTNDSTALGDAMLAKLRGEDVSTEVVPASNAAVSTADLYKQRQFEFSFTVEKVSCIVSRESFAPEEKHHLLASLELSGFELLFTKRQFDMSANVILRSLVVFDHQNGSLDNHSHTLISSYDTNGADNSDEALFTVSYTKIEKDHPEYTSVYSGFDQIVDLSLSTLNFTITRSSVIELLSFLLATFVDGSKSPENGVPKNEFANADVSIESSEAEEDSRLKLELQLSGISIVFDDDGNKLATLSLSKAGVSVTLAGDAIRVEAKLGRFYLEDNSSSNLTKENQDLRKLIFIDGDQLADFKYESNGKLTDAANHATSLLYFRCASINIRFAQEPFSQLISFLIRFQRMKVFYDSAREAAVAQASQIETPSNMKLDIFIGAPVFSFPRKSPHGTRADFLVADLGEVSIQNEFISIDTGDTLLNKIEANLTRTKISSQIWTNESTRQDLEIVNDLDLGLVALCADHDKLPDRSEIAVTSKFNDVTFNVSDLQYQYIMWVAESLPKTLSGATKVDIDTDIEEGSHINIERFSRETSITSSFSGDSDMADQTVSAGSTLSVLKEPQTQDTVSSTHLAPELVLENTKDVWSKLELSFAMDKIGLNLYIDTENVDQENIKDCMLTEFSLHDISADLKLTNTGDMESEIRVRSFSVVDRRSNINSLYREIIPTSIEDGYQFSVRISIASGLPSTLYAILTVDSPRIVFNLSYLFELKRFFIVPASVTSAYPNDEDLQEETDDLEEEDSSNNQPGMSINYRVNVVNGSLMFIENPEKSNSLAIVLRSRQIMISQQSSMTMLIKDVGMFLTYADAVETKHARILDDMSIAFSMNSQTTSETFSVTNIEVDFDKIILRLSLRDILLASMIFNKAMEFSQKQTSLLPTSEDVAELGRTHHLRQRGNSIAAMPRKKAKTNAGPKNIEELISREELVVKFAGLRLILVTSPQELPMLDLSVDPFTFTLRNWSSELEGTLTVDMKCNVYNFSKSVWEPLIEPWSFGVHFNQSGSISNEMMVEFRARKSLEMNITTRTIALASHAMRTLSSPTDIGSRTVEDPYWIVNETGHKLIITADRMGYGRDEKVPAARVGNLEEIPWHFRDWQTMREDVDIEKENSFVSIHFDDNKYKDVDKVKITSEGMELHPLSPEDNGFVHKLVCQVTMEDISGIKNIKLRSTYNFENTTDVDLEIMVEWNENVETYSIQPGKERSIPIDYVQSDNIRIRPLTHSLHPGYSWSRNTLHWKSMVTDATKVLECVEQKNKEPFFLQAHAILAKADLKAMLRYPYLSVRFCAPLQVQNLMPFDIRYRVFDRDSRQTWEGELKKGEKQNIHCVLLTHLLLLSIEIHSQGYSKSNFAVLVNNTQGVQATREYDLNCSNKESHKLRLKLHYHTIPNSGGAFCVSVYAPYIILNKTGQDILLRTRTNVMTSKYAQEIADVGDNPRMVALPKLFSFTSDSTRNRAVIESGERFKSAPVSFDAIGSVKEIKLLSEIKQSSMHLGIAVEEGKGDIRLSKVVTLTPRFVLTNRLNADIRVRESGSTSYRTIESSKTLPFLYFREGSDMQVSFSFSGSKAQWSVPVRICDIGHVHVRLVNNNKHHDLLRLDIYIEGATIFVQLSRESKAWPYSIRNYTNMEFIFSQSDPQVFLDMDKEAVLASTKSNFKPIRYKIPPKSVMPYAWDYPSAVNKELVIEARGVERHVNLAEIGTLPPLVIPSGDSFDENYIVQLDVVAEGPSESLMITEYDAETSPYKLKNGKSLRRDSRTTQKSSEKDFEIETDKSPISLQVTLKLQGLGISLVNRHHAELCYVNIRGLEMVYTESEEYQSISTKMKWIQIDNDLYGGQYPIILYPTRLPTSGLEIENHPVLSASVCRMKDDSHGVLAIKYATILLQELTFEIDEDFLYAVIDFIDIPGAAWNLQQNSAPLADSLLILEPPETGAPNTEVYFEVLHIQPILINLSFMRTDRFSDDETISTDTVFGYVLNVLTMTLGNINDAPIKLNALYLENLKDSYDVLGATMIRYYTQEVLYQMHKILGSADFIGNPVGLFNNISSGFMDMFYEPYMGFVMNDRPQDLGIGLAKGGASFFKKSVFGISDSVSKVSASLGKGLAAASMDEDYQRRRRQLLRNRTQRGHSGVANGASSLLNGITSAITGVALTPMQEASKDGASGFVRGLGKGLLGVPMKTVAGMVDFAGNISQEIRESTSVLDDKSLDRVRLPRFIGREGILRSYSEREALGQCWLKLTNEGEFFNHDYIGHVNIQGGKAVIVSYEEIIMVSISKLRAEWIVCIKDLQKVVQERTGIELIVKREAQGPFIPLGDASSREYLYEKISDAVKEYNRLASVD